MPNPDSAEQRLRDLASVFGGWLWETDDEFRFTWLSDDVFKYLGLRPQWHYGKTRAEVASANLDSEEWAVHMATIEAHGRFDKFTFSAMLPQGKRWIRVSGIPRFDRSRKFLGHHGIAEDITETLNLADQSRELERRFSEVLSVIEDGYSLWSKDGHLIACNRVWRYQHHGHIADILEPGVSYETLIRTSVSRGQVVETNVGTDNFVQRRVRDFGRTGDIVEVTRPSGQVVEVLGFQAKHGDVIRITRDITSRKVREREQLALENQLHDAQRMESIGKLAGGIAHDFNNTLQVMLGFADLATAHLEPDAKPELRSYLQRISDSGEQAGRVVAQLLAFSRGGTIPNKRHVLGTMVETVAALLKATLPSSIDVVVDIRAPDAEVIADETQLQQVLMNLAINSRDATNHRGVIRIVVDAPQDSILTCSSCAQTSSGRTVGLSIEDSGPGIDPAQSAQVFEPFFTTKPHGQGSGMGLSVVHGLVHAIGGHILLDKSPLGGARFTMRLPAVSPLPAGPSLPETASDHPPK
jgi:signal transduction histidine kinase